MENVKIDENRLVPDIRPENIETITETYTPSGGGEQTTTYKILNVHPIINGVLDKLAFFRTHVGAVWYNLLERKTLLAKLNEMDKEIEQLKSKAMLKLADSERFDVTVGAGRYAQVPDKLIPGTRSYLFATVKIWSASGSVFSVAGAGRAFWVIGDPDKRVTGLQLRFWYME